MRLLYLTEEKISFSDAMVRGGAIHIKRVVEGLRERGHEVFLIDWNEAPERPYQRSVATRTRFFDGPARTYWQAISVGQTQGAEVIVSKTRKTYLPGLLAAQRLGVPHVVHVGSSLSPPTDGFLNRLDLMSARTRIRLPHDAYLTVCQFLADQLREYVSSTAAIYNVRNAVDTDWFHPDRVSTPLDDQFVRRLPADGPLRLGFVGGLYDYKGVHDLAAAVERCEANVAVVFAGSGPERKSLKARLGSDGHFLGSVPYNQIPALYHAVDVFVLPSHTEGLPRVILEAQATATPVLATGVGGVPEVVTDEETGLLCRPQDPRQLARGIDRLAEDPNERDRLGANGRAQVVDTFTWSTLFDRYEQFLNDVITDANSRQSISSEVGE